MTATDDLLEFMDSVKRYGFARIVPSTDLDSLIASGVLLKTLIDNGISAVLNLDPKVTIDNKDEPVLLVNLPLPAGRGNALSLVFDGSSSLTAVVAYALSRSYKISRWVKVLALIAGVYRWLDLGKDGFKGLERQILEELTSSNYVVKEAGFRLPGWRKTSLAKSIYRSLIPYVPGFTGRWDNTVSLIKSVFGEVDVEKFYGSHVFDKRDASAINDFLRKIDQSLTQINDEAKRRIMYRLVGFVYYIDLDGFTLDFIEAINALSIVLSLDERNPIYVVMTGFSKEFLSEAIYVYGEIVEKIVPVIASVIDSYIMGKSSCIVIENYIKRPELVIDVLDHLGRVASDKVLYVNIGGERVTTASTLLKHGFTMENVFSMCDENQICRVEDNGALSKA